MSRIIITGFEGSHHEQLSEITCGALAAYAACVGADFARVRLPDNVSRPASWKKLIAIAAGLARYAEVLWVDADVAVVNTSRNIFAETPPEAVNAMVCHHTDEGDVPNAGVWLVRRPILPDLVTAAMDDAAVNHKWWEQAAIHRLLGFSSNSGTCRQENVTPLAEATHWLGEEWNVWHGSSPDIKPLFRHACGKQGDERLQLVLEWSKAKEAHSAK